MTIMSSARLRVSLPISVRRADRTILSEAVLVLELGFYVFEYEPEYTYEYE